MKRIWFTIRDWIDDIVTLWIDKVQWWWRVKTEQQQRRRQCWNLYITNKRAACTYAYTASKGNDDEIYISVFFVFGYFKACSSSQQQQKKQQHSLFLFDNFDTDLSDESAEWMTVITEFARDDLGFIK